jgi:hypothetical protein
MHLVALMRSKNATASDVAKHRVPALQSSNSVTRPPRTSAFPLFFFDGREVVWPFLRGAATPSNRLPRFARLLRTGTLRNTIFC